MDEHWKFGFRRRGISSHAFHDSTQFKQQTALRVSENPFFMMYMHSLFCQYFNSLAQAASGLYIAEGQMDEQNQQYLAIVNW